MSRLTYIFTTILLILAFGTASVCAQPRIRGNVYGGGENAKVLGQKLDAGNWVDDHGDGTVTTKVTVNNGDVQGEVYGAGKGVTVDEATKVSTTYDNVATVNGNTEVNLDAHDAANDQVGTVWGNVYGGAALAIVTGNANVNVTGGKFASDLFGGGKGNVAGSNITSANVLKNTHVDITAGEIVWDQIINDEGEIETWSSSNDSLFFDKERNRYITDHNIYAGGDIASVVGTWSDANTLSDANTGTSTLTMTRGLLNKDLLSSSEWKQAFAQHENPHFYAFGGGFGIYTKAHKSDVQIFLPMFEDVSADGGDEQLARPRRAAGDKTTLDIDLITDYYGVPWTTVLGILGGGYNGHVETTNVLVGDATYAHRVYGGGLGSYEGWVEAGRPADAAAAASALGKVGTVGPLTGEPSTTEPVAHVTLAGGHIFGDVFGGGAGVAPRKLDGSSPAYTDFTEIARVKGNTLVETYAYRGYKFKLFYEALAEYIAAHGKYTKPDPENHNLNKPDQYFSETDKKQHALVYGNVYGGGDVANVSGNTKVWYRGGKVFGNTFGAGLGRLASEAADYKQIGRVTGNSEVEVNDTILVPFVSMDNLPDAWQADEDILDVTGKVYERDNFDTNDDDWPVASKHCYFVVQDATQAIGINFKPHAWDDIYGGGRNGITAGDATVTISGGLVGNNVFGGGLGNVGKDAEGHDVVTSADVLGNTTVTIRGGKYLWRQIADINGNIKDFPKTVPAGYDGDYNGYDKPFNRNVIDNKMMLTQMFEPIKAFFDYNKASYTRDHSIYGGGNIACKVGTYVNDDDDEDLLDAPTSGGKATVNMMHGLFEDEDIRWTDDDEWNLATLCRYLACENSANYQFGVFGGGYGAHTKVGETEVTLRMGGVELLKEAADPEYMSIWKRYMGTIASWYNKLDPETQAEIYGGGVGVNAENRYLTARMARSINVPSHTVLTTAGGGLAGYVAGNTKVDLKQRSGALRIYGGGIGQRPTASELANLDQTGADHFTYGQVGGSTSVDIEYGVVVKDVFGGGAGIESMQNNNGEYVDFTNMARVIGKTEVKIHAADGVPTQTLVYGRVFGGGDVANVGAKEYEVTEPQNSATFQRDVPRSKVSVTSGCVFNDVFAGGSGRASELCSDYTKLGAIYGNAQLVIDQPEVNGDNATWLWKNVYGGGRNGTIYGNTLVQIEGGWLGQDVFGGGLGNIGTKHNPVSGEEEEAITQANVTQNTNVLVTGGQYCLSQTWDEVERNWERVNKDPESGTLYSSQYDYKNKKFLVSHNVYGGGNVACEVGHDTWVDMTKGLLPKENRLGHKNTEDLFAENEWREIHDKHASPYFSVFGGGYGVNTNVGNDSHVTIDMELTTTKPGDYVDPTESDLYLAFYDRQSLLDVIGGGYEGAVTNTCNIDIKGNSFMRNVFGGAYYATVGNTVINATRGNIENIYGGGMMGDVHTDVTLNLGQAYADGDPEDEKTAKREDNSQLYIMQSIYGGNDVSGYVGASENADGTVTATEESQGITMRLNGGTILRNVYGGGNGNYMYHIDEDVTKVEAVEDYPVGDGVTTLVYNVPLRGAYFPSFGAMSNQQKMVNLASYRPNTMKVDIGFKGNTAEDRLTIKGNLFGGGNSATISQYTNEAQAKVKIDAGSHATLGGLFLGSDGDALFDYETNFIEYYSAINSMKLYQSIDWELPENQNIPTLFLPTPRPERPNVYKNNIDLYFLPIEMSVMPEMTWNGLNSSTSAAAGGAMNPSFAYANPGIEDLWIGTFCCGGNRGNMNTDTRFHIHFPEGLTITENVIGGCNNANFNRTLAELDDEGNPIELKHTGGFLLGTHNVGTGHEPQINLTLRNKFYIEPEKDSEGNEIEPAIYPEKCNVFGGCYTGGTVRGDIRIDVLSNMLMSASANSVAGLDSLALRRATDNSRTVCGIYGGGFGPNTWVYGDTEVRLGNADAACNSTYAGNGIYNTSGASCNYIFGGGREGNIVGNSIVRVLNGRVGGCVVGASYSGILYGNSQVVVGYPTHYVCEESGEYQLERVDNDPQHKYYVDAFNVPVIKQSIWHTKGDLISKASLEEIKWPVGTTDADKERMFPVSNYIDYPTEAQWGRINIQIDKAVYGGGYAIAGGGGVGSGSYTVRKYTEEYNLNEYAEDIYGLAEGHTLDNDNGAAYGGNTIVMIGDRTEVDNTDNGDGTTGRDHITVSSSQLEPYQPKENQNLFGLYHEVTNDNDTKDDTSDDFITIEYIHNDILFKEATHKEKFYRYTGEGGIYGDGHLSLSEGFRLSDIYGYGYNGTSPIKAKLMNCLHRFDIVRLTDCCFSLLGDRDYASAAGSAIDATPYSIANVGEIKMFSSLDKNETLMDPLKDKRSRNYMGLSNRVQNIGAVYSDVSFDDKFHHGNEGKYNKDIGGGTSNKGHENYGVADEQNITYRNFKKKMIETWYDCTNGKVKDITGAAIYFQLRNDGTAKNLIGIGSGYALFVEYEFDRMKTQTILEAQHALTPSITTIPDNQGVDGTYFGPVKGVFEVNLISVREGEAGGYVYAQNMHEDGPYGAAYGNSDHGVHFLETSGNFVFPVTSQRKVIDDCFPTKYNVEHKHSSADGHYWYVTGLKYFYNATITGYTFDDDEMEFDMANANLITMTGSKAKQPVTLKDFHIVNRHESNTYECDFERDVNGDHTGFDLLNQTDATSASMADKYTFSISASKQTTFTKGYDKDSNGDIIPVPFLETMQLNNLGEGQNTVLGTGLLDQNDAPISIRLTDNVKNNGKLNDGVTSYYDAHLSDPCQAVILLTSPALDDNGFPVYKNDMFEQLDVTGETVPVSGKQYYVLNFDGTYLGLNDGDLSNYNTQETRKLLYVLKNFRELTTEEKAAPAPDSNVKYYTSTDNGKTGTEITGDELTTAWAGDKANIYVVPTSVNYEYTIDLSIRYIKGPSHSGHINIKNCALPGEMIRISHENVVVESDENSLPHNGNFWIIGPGKKVWEDKEDHSKGWHWEFVDDYTGTSSRQGVDMFGNANTELHYNNPNGKNIYYPYNPFVTDPEDRYRTSAFNTVARNGIYHANSAEAKDYFVPAYYYMNGYVAQYCYTVQGINRVFRTDIQPVDTLCVHNYHRMVNVNDMPANTGDKAIPHDLYVPMAAQAFAAENAPDPDPDPNIKVEPGVHARPRVYIQDVNDLRAFAQYLQRDETKRTPVIILPGAYNAGGSNLTYAEIDKPATDFGANTDFFLMANIEVPNTWTPIANFKGSLHGNGHVISGLGDKALFTDLDVENGAHIYNLGLQSGSIASTEKPAAYSNCYTFANNTVYHMDGTTPDTHYTDDDWRTGRVAYDLNEYYLAERLDRNSDSDDDHDHAGYVESIYANGDYRYARYNTAPATSEYLRTQAIPLYGWGFDQTIMESVDNDPDAHISRHAYTYNKATNVLGHSVDETRAYYNAAVDAVLYTDAAEYNAAKGTSLDDAGFTALSDAEKTKTPAKPRTLNEYRPLFNEAHVAGNGSAATDMKNDYLFFGQTINDASYTNTFGTVGSNLPTIIAANSNTSQPGNANGVTHALDAQTNRVWRAYGFYRSKADDAFHFNKAAWALHPELTAIDFTGQHESLHNWDAGCYDGTRPATQDDVDASKAANLGDPIRLAGTIFYPKVMDMPDALTSFNVRSNKDVTPYSNATYERVTQNLLVYNNNDMEPGSDPAVPIFNKKDVADIAEKDVVYHNIALTGDPATFTTDYFHLVDKQDFNAPIAFAVNTRAWYERLPQNYRNVPGASTPGALDYSSPSAWEGICLPFTATKVAAEKNGEISHFYGEEDGADHSLHHEYWLRGLTAVEDNVATFARPAIAGSNQFVEANQTAAKIDTYTYPANTYFITLYNYNNHYDTRDDEDDDTFGQHNEAWYAKSHAFADYTPLTAEVPYIVAFPGDDYYEFSMQSYYKTAEYGSVAYRQKATFESGATRIHVSDDNMVSTAVTGYTHNGTFLHKSDTHGVNDNGSAFKAVASIVPFRTYMTASSGGSVNRRNVIYIGEGESEADEMQPEYNYPEEDPDSNDEEPQLKIYSLGKGKLGITSNYSTTLTVYTTAGQHYRTIEVTPGTQTYSGFHTGIYLIGNQKISLR